MKWTTYGRIPPCPKEMLTYEEYKRRHRPPFEEMLKPFIPIATEAEQWTKKYDEAMAESAKEIAKNIEHRLFAQLGKPALASGLPSGWIVPTTTNTIWTTTGTSATLIPTVSYSTTSGSAFSNGTFKLATR